MIRIIKFIIKCILFTIIGAAFLFSSPVAIIMTMAHILFVWAKNDTPFLTCAKVGLTSYLDTFNPYRIVFKKDDV